ncbi:MAG: O-antigen ligase family protein [Caldilineaceae bacterium]|nr:O-antigen ligase family protein [Caldilineaceae bacterium]
MNLRRYWDIPLFVELLLLAITAPVLYFPSRFSGGELAGAIGILAMGWVWRRLTIGVWFRRTPADWPLFFLFLVMLPVAVWAAPGPLREQYSIPKACILIWNIALFWTIVVHGSRRSELQNLCGAGFVLAGGAIALLAIFGTAWPDKIFGLSNILARIPHLLGGVFERASGGFNSNVVAGSLLYVLPFALALTITALFRKERSYPVLLPLFFVTGVIGLVFVAVQSRGGLIGLTIGLLAMLLVNWRWGRWLLLGGGLAVIIGLAATPIDFLASAVEAAQDAQTVVGSLTLSGRIEIWSRALYGIQDFSFTGMGLGTFSRIAPILYPLFLIPPDYDFGHAHNIFLQTALDFGIPGLIAFLAIYVSGIGVVIRLWRTPLSPERRGWVLGMGGVLIAHTIYSMADAITMGANNNFLFWWLFALLFAMGQLTPKRSIQRSDAS